MSLKMVFIFTLKIYQDTLNKNIIYLFKVMKPFVVKSG